MLLHVDVIVQNMEQMLEFYCQKLGFQVVDDAVISGEAPMTLSHHSCNTYRIVLLKVPFSHTMIELIQFVDMPKSKNHSPHVTFTIWVKSLESTYATLAQKNIFPISNTISVCLPQMGKSKILFYEDPEKNLVEYLVMEGK